jgi:DNA-binding NarL/FixJ family response regulator
LIKYFGDLLQAYGGRIPVLVLTTSNAESDIMNTYDLGMNSYIQKPVRFSELVEIAKSVVDYWFKTVKLPLKLY